MSEEIPEPEFSISPAVGNRITVINTAVHQDVVHRSGTFTEQHGFSYRLASDEQPYSRRTALATTDPTELDTGWLKKSFSVLVVRNRSGEGRATIPTEDEQARIEQQVLELGIVGPAGFVPLLEIPPGQSQMILHPRETVSWALRAAVAPLPYSVSVYPK